MRRTTMKPTPMKPITMKPITKPVTKPVTKPITKLITGARVAGTRSMGTRSMGTRLLSGLTRAAIVLLALSATVGCSDLGTEPEGAVATAIVLDRSELRIGSLGESVRVEARVLDQFGREMPGAQLIWFVEDPSVATVEADDRVLARRNGETIVQIVVDQGRSRSTPSGYRSGRAKTELRVQVRQDVGSFEFTPGTVSLWAVGQSRQMSVVVRDPLGSPFERALSVRWESENTGIAEVTPDGRVVAREDGSASVRAVTAEGVGVATIQVATRFTFAACVSSSVSRLGQNPAGASRSGTDGENVGLGESCVSTPLRAVARVTPDV